jgi:hypothetical protein
MDFDLENLQKEDLKKLSDINQIKHNNIISLFKIIKKKNEKIRTLFSNIFNRELNSDSFFFHLLLITLIDEKIKKKKISRIYINNKSLGRVIKSKYPNIEISIKQKKNSFLIIKNFFFLMQIIIQGILNKSSLRLKKLEEKKDLILIETFFLENMFSNQGMKERYTHDIKKFSDKKTQDRIIFFVNSLLTKNIKKSLILARIKLNDFILVHDVLSIKDYFKIIKDSFFFKFDKNIIYNGFNLKYLLRHHLKKDIFDVRFFLAFSNYLFFMKLKKKKVKIKKVIDWYENQQIDKGFNLGINIFYSKIKSKGYVGFVNDFQNCLNYIPSQFEVQNCLTPKEILLTGKKIIPFYRKLNKVTQIKLVPALRNQYFYEKIKLQKKLLLNKKIDILIILSADNEENHNVNKIIQLIETKYSQTFNLKIKTHVMNDLRGFKIDKRYIINKNILIQKAIENSTIVICGASTAVFDAILSKKFVLVMAKKNEIKINPLNLYKLIKNYTICQSISEYENIFKKIIDSKIKINNINTNNILNNLFQKKTKKTFANFFN